jgi:hypothetical protein
MHTLRFRFSFAAWTLLAGLQVPAWAQVASPVPIRAEDSAGRGTAAASDPYVWRGHEMEIEDFLRNGTITHFKDIPVGITKPQRGYFAPGGPATSMAWKPLHDEMLHGKMESYRSEIAAYLLSRHLGLDMVPPVVERQVKGVKGAAVFWIEGVRPWDPSSPPKVPGANWSRQTSRMFMFDQLIANIDRNQGNLLLDDGGHVFLIDHSRAFTPKPNLMGLNAPQQFDRGLWNRMAALTRADLDALLGAWLTNLQIESVLSRRDEMQRHIERQVRDRGDAVTFLPPAPASPDRSSN